MKKYHRLLWIWCRIQSNIKTLPLKVKK